MKIWCILNKIYDLKTGKTTKTWKQLMISKINKCKLKITNQPNTYLHNKLEKKLG